MWELSGLSLTVTNNRASLCVKVKVEYKPDLFLIKEAFVRKCCQQGSMVCKFIQHNF